MKKVFKYVLLLILLIPAKVFASEINVYTKDDFLSALLSENEIKLQNNVTLDSNTFINQNTTINLNGYTITMSNSTLAVRANTIIKDTSNEQNGKIIANDGFVIQVSGSYGEIELIIESGSIEGTVYGIDNKSKLTINGGKIIADSYTIYNENTLTINNGEVIANTGYAIYNKENASFEINDGKIICNGDNQTINLSGSCSGVINGGRIEGMYQDGNSGGTGIAAFKNTTLTINGGLIQSYGSTIMGNGSMSGNNEGTNAKFYINGGTIISTIGAAIYAPQINGETVISGGTLRGKTGIEIKGGSLTITGGSIIADSENYDVISNPGGLTTRGTAISISQNTNKQPITVNITGGSLSGYYAFTEENPMNNSAEDLEKIEIDVSGGTFHDNTTESFKVIDQEPFVSGGLFDHTVTEYVKDGYGEVELTEQIEITKTHELEADDEFLSILGLGSAPIPYKTEVTIPLSEEELDGKEIQIIDAYGNIVPIIDNHFTMPNSSITIMLVDKINNPKTNTNSDIQLTLLVIILVVIEFITIYKKHRNLSA